MPFAKVTFGVGLLLFGAAAVGVAGTWALAASTVVMGLASLVAVIVMEERDCTGIEGLYPAASDSREPVIAELVAEAPMARAA